VKLRPPSDTKEFLAWLRGEAADAVFHLQLRDFTGERRMYSAHDPGTRQSREDGSDSQPPCASPKHG